MSLQYQTDEGQEELIEAEPAASQSVVRSEIPYYTYTLLACIVAVSAAQFAAGIQRSALIAGFDKPAFVHDHEYWRIITGAVLHGGMLHLAMNGYALYSFGKLFEVLTNRAHLAVVFLASAIGGGVLSLIFLPDGISVGASGGIVGLIGYLAVYAFRRRQFISAEFRRSLLFNIGFIFVVGVAVLPNIDNFGHLGGLLTGAIYGFFQISGDQFVDPRGAGSAPTTLGLVALGIYIAAALFSIFLILYA